jgi:hypothetical protein
MGLGPAQRPILLNAVRGLVDAARSERASMRPRAANRPFYLDVEAAAEEVLHPELAMSRGDDWLDHEPAAFREGYQRTRTLLTAARTAPEPPLRLPLPEPRSSPPPDQRH